MSVDPLPGEIFERVKPRLDMVMAEPRALTNPGKVAHPLSQLFKSNKDLELVKVTLVDEDGYKRFIAVQVVRKGAEVSHVNVTEVVSSEYDLDKQFIVADSPKDAPKLAEMSVTLFGPFKRERRPKTRARRPF